MREVQGDLVFGEVKSRFAHWARVLTLALGNASCTGIVEGSADLPNLGLGGSAAGGASAGGASAGGAASGGSPSGTRFGQCATCHGPTGEGSALGYEIRHPVRPYSTWVVRNGRTGGEFSGSAMLAYGPSTLTDAELEDIFDYLDSFAQPTTGEGLYQDNCRNCHGADARGGVTGVDISDKNYEDALEKVRGGEGGNDYADRSQYMPAFAGDVLSDAEVRTIAEYLGTL